jgi:hypothetical protein
MRGGLFAGVGPALATQMILCSILFGAQNKIKVTLEGLNGI